jgi:secreted trypsin-like serine protease
VGGSYSINGQWPWLASLFYSNTNAFFCGASLISETNLLSAAHCFVENPRPSQSYAVMGHFEIDEFTTNPNSVRRDFLAITIHSDYRRGNQSADADIAVIKMKQPVAFTQFIQPVCLPNSNDKSENVEGTVVGYGKSEFTTRAEKYPKHVTIQSTDLLTCYTRDFGFVQIASKRSFCAGGNGQSPCKGETN